MSSSKSLPVIVAATRTAIGNFNGSISSVPASTLGSTCIKALISRTGLDPALVHEVIMGQVLQTGCGQNPARQAALNAGLPHTVPALTINKVCGSGLKSVMHAAESLIVNEILNPGTDRFIIAGGQENMSLSPRVLPNSRNLAKMGDLTLKDTMIQDGLWCAFNDYHMGITAENIVSKHSITREAQDEFALNSQLKANNAIANGHFDAEITPVEMPNRRGDPTIFSQDEFPKNKPTIESFQKLRPAFKRDGTVTAGNASGLNDGAAGLMLTSKATAIKHSLPILATVKSFASAGIDPKIMGLGVVPAVQKCLEPLNWELNKDIDRIEANEAFAAQSLGVIKELGLTENTVNEKVNVNGGAIALGHPIGASGARILVSLVHELHRSGKSTGLATLCIGGGQGVAMAVEVE